MKAEIPKLVRIDLDEGMELESKQFDNKEVKCFFQKLRKEYEIKPEVKALNDWKRRFENRNGYTPTNIPIKKVLEILSTGKIDDSSELNQEE